MKSDRFPLSHARALSHVETLSMPTRHNHRLGCWLFSLFIGGAIACSTDEPNALFGKSLEVNQSSCQREDRWRDQGPKVEEVALVRGITGPEVHASLWFNCAVGEICAEERREEKTSSLDILFFPCQPITDSLAKCDCWIELRSPVNVEEVNRIRVFKQPLRHSGQPEKRNTVAEIEIGSE